ncbi:hypothetical protein JCM10207_006256 [Rhodosporidiobolus poonsookiae]
MPPRSPRGDDLVYALHSFEAENDDELAFEAGERIVVLERDDQYGDGWYQGRNERGEIGLFPKSYTSSRPPSFYPFDSADLPSPLTEQPATIAEAPASEGDASTSAANGSSATAAPGEPSSLGPATSSGLAAAPTLSVSPSPSRTSLSALNTTRRLSTSGASVHSRASELTRDYDDLDEADEPSRPADGAGHRAALAERARENAEKAQREARERQERKRREDEEAYERLRREGLIEGLGLSDESEPEDEGEGEKEVLREVETAPERPPLGESRSSRSEYAGEPSADASRPRADTQPSTYAESVYSTTSSAPPQSSPQKVVTDLPSPPVAAVVTPSPTSASASAAPAAEAEKPTEEAAPPAASEPTPAPAADAPSSSPTSTTASDALHTAQNALTTAGAALAGAATTAVAAAGVGLGSSPTSATGERTPSPSPAEAAAAPEPELPKEAAPVLAAEPAKEAEQTAAPVAPQEAVQPDPTPAAAAAASTATAAPALAPLSTAPTTTGAVAEVSPVPATAATDGHSPAAALKTTAVNGNGHDGALTSSPAHGAFPAASAGEEKEKEKKDGGDAGLPDDPMSWSVQDVVSWAKGKGFDEMTVGKFEEHEISGDVLLEMDVAMLKEIDLVAFGRRVHIYNAIKELKQRTHPELFPPPQSHHPHSGSSFLSASQSTAATSTFLSPTLSMAGYEPDSPGSLAASPTVASFQSPQMRWDQQSHPHPHGKLAGLGFEEDSQGGSLRAPSSLGQQSVSNLRSSRTSASGGAPHQRSATFDSFDASAPHSASSHGHGESLAAQPVREEGASTDADAEKGTAKRREKKSSLAVRPSTATSLRPKSTRKGTRDGESSATSVPTSPDLGASTSSRKGSKSGESGGMSFFGATLPGLPGRSRKPPPRVPSALLLDSNGAIPRPRPRSGIQDRAKRSTRLFGAFSGGSGSEKSPTTDGVRSRASNSTLGTAVGRDAPTTMKPKEVDPATAEMLRAKEEAVRDGNLMDKIGRPDHSGWMRKKGEKYNSWKMRFFVLKGVYLYYLKSEQEQKAKGVIDLTGYRVLSDPNIHPGEFAFKLVHDRGRTHFFSATEQVTVRSWMKEIMKATILRDYSAPVVSSCDIDVLPLEVAKTMTPYPRPPSPERRAQIQKARYAGTNPNTLSQKDAAILMDFAPGSPLMNGEALWSSAASKPETKRKSSAVSVAKSDTPTEQAPRSPPLGSTTPTMNGMSTTPTPPATTRLTRATSDTSRGELLGWVNANLPSSCPLATDLAYSLRSGRLLVRLLENLSGEQSGISDEQFDQFHQQEGQPFDTAYLDTIFSVFDFLSPLVSTDDLSMEDMITGNEERLTILVERMRTKYPAPAALAE